MQASLGESNEYRRRFFFRFEHERERERASSLSGERIESKREIIDHKFLVVLGRGTTLTMMMMSITKNDEFNDDKSGVDRNDDGDDVVNYNERWKMSTKVILPSLLVH